jgi:flagellar biogenesis protein FliO
MISRARATNDRRLIMLFGRVVVIVLLVILVAWVLGGLLRGRPQRNRRNRRRYR